MGMFATVIRQRSIQVLLLISLYLLFAPVLPIDVHRAFYTVSLFIKDLLLWFLPVTVSLFIAYAISSFRRQAPVFVLTLFVFEALSNTTSVLYAFGCGHVASSYFGNMVPHELSSAFEPLWRLPFVKPGWWSADKGTIVGIGAGLIAAFSSPFLGEIIARGKGVVEKVLTRGFSRLIPLFVLGFIARMVQTKLLTQMFVEYGDFFLWLLFILFSYIAFFLWAGCDFSLKKFWVSLKNLAPAGGMAFSSGCSLSTMPWTIEGTSKNLEHPDFAKLVIPATTNVQQIGDCIANAFLCFLIYLYFNGHPPSLAVWLPFTVVFVLARFATAAVLGGAIFIMLPIYETYLGFTPEMIAIILAFNVILDPLITSSNVVANGVFCRVFEKVWLGFRQKIPE